MTQRYLTNHLIAMVICMTGLAVPVVSNAQPVAPAMSQEYFIQQADDEDLLITISVFEAEFESRISGPNNEILLRSGIPDSRIVPVFQYIYAPKSSRQLDIEVTSGLYTGRTEFGIELARLKPWDSRSSSVSQAYKLLSFGSEISGADNKASWTVKIDSLVKASQLFQQFGMQEMRFWADYMTAHLIYFHLHDHSYVYSMTREILKNVKNTRLRKIELATLQLQSLALIGLRRSGSLNLSPENTDPIQAVLAQAAELADDTGFHFEQARALYASGVEFANQAFYPNALEQFQLAVELADSVGSAELATAIRESIVQIHTIQGDAPATSEVLQEIETQLVEDGGGDDLALNLLAQARLLITSYHYGEALEVLSGALSYENNSAIRRQINFELARIHYETGRLDESMAYLELAEINPDSRQKIRGNPVIDIGEGLRIMANIHRIKAQYEAMQNARRAQGQQQPPPDQYLYDQGLDVIARAGKNRQQAASFFRQSQTAASTAGHIDLKHLARLQYCALVGAEDSLCSKPAVKTAYEWLLNGGVPRFTTEAMFLWSQIRVLDGQRSEALSVFDRMADEIHLLRDSLPGVLGAWYWNRHELVFETWLKLLVTNSNQGGRADGSVSLLALSKIRYIENYTGSELDVSRRSVATDLVRDQLAQRANHGAGQARFALNDKINGELDKLRANFRKRFEFLSANGLQKHLRSLANDEAVLTYHISRSLAQVWVAHKGKVQRRDIANPTGLYQTLRTARQDLANIGLAAFDNRMAELGKRLVGPITDLLTENIYWITAGPLLGFPVDALRISGRYLIERHTVVNLLSFPVSTDPDKSLQSGSMQKVFLAGNPLDYAGDYASRLETSAEIQMLADIFVGPGLQIVQGLALLPDEFQGEYFLQSDLIHLSMPGTVNLKFPGDSGFELSEGEYEPGRTVLKPADIRSQKLTAGLVFLSSTRLFENPLSDFTSQPGLVSDFVDAGARSVAVNFWSSDAESNEAFIADFYRRLQGAGNIAGSLHTSRLQYLKNNRDNGRYDWAGYQLFIR
ncbi:MAG: CHAT domain-containing protein [Xanthomonadales bacterium]|nr:CHAT domain-containing protein [Xanthomonadales bacterium]